MAIFKAKKKVVAAANNIFFNTIGWSNCVNSRKRFSSFYIRNILKLKVMD